ncbi:unnamed protein product, partial [Phaeothamnion confervicola]
VNGDHRKFQQLVREAQAKYLDRSDAAGSGTTAASVAAAASDSRRLSPLLQSHQRALDRDMHELERTRGIVDKHRTDTEEALVRRHGVERKRLETFVASVTHRYQFAMGPTARQEVLGRIWAFFFGDPFYTMIFGGTQYVSPLDGAADTLVQ